MRLTAVVLALALCAVAPPVPRLTMMIPWKWVDWDEWFRAKQVVTPIGICDITEDRWGTTGNTMLEADVIVFLWTSVTERPPHVVRPRGKLWVMFTGESPGVYFNYNRYAMEYLNGSINVVMNYQRSATVRAPYGYSRLLAGPRDDIPSDIQMARPNVAVIVYSNCDAVLRNQRLNQLRAHIQIDEMGKCGSVRDEVCDARRPECYENLAKRYLFYIAIENSDCEDYVTEKAWANSLRAGMVPIVWEANVDYAAILPHRSYVSITDYASVEEAARVINEMALHPHLYRRYHEWRKDTEVVVPTPMQHGVALCEFAHRNLGRELPAINLYGRWKECS